MQAVSWCPVRALCGPARWLPIPGRAARDPPLGSGHFPCRKPLLLPLGMEIHRVRSSLSLVLARNHSSRQVRTSHLIEWETEAQAEISARPLPGHQAHGPDFTVMASSQHQSPKQTKQKTNFQYAGDSKQACGAGGGIETGPRGDGNKRTPLPVLRLLESGHLLVCGFTEFELKGSTRYHLPAVSAWSGFLLRDKALFKKTMIQGTPMRGRRGGCVCGWGPHRSSAQQHPFLLPCPGGPD